MLGHAQRQERYYIQVFSLADHLKYLLLWRWSVFSVVWMCESVSIVDVTCGVCTFRIKLNVPVSPPTLHHLPLPAKASRHENRVQLCQKEIAPQVMHPNLQRTAAVSLPSSKKKSIKGKECECFCVFLGFITNYFYSIFVFSALINEHLWLVILHKFQEKNNHDP